ncbi:MAG: hypothetical protein PHU46_07490, partial [Rhodocyclaceae bacterium]|nr:hypothetical protein [Rhodocyclaceae bacterium]
PGGLPWKTLRVSHRAPLCPQAPQTNHHFYVFFKNRTYKAQRRGENHAFRELNIFQWKDDSATSWECFSSAPPRLCG